MSRSPIATDRPMHYSVTWQTLCLPDKREGNQGGPRSGSPLNPSPNDINSHTIYIHCLAPRACWTAVWLSRKLLENSNLYHDERRSDVTVISGHISSNMVADRFEARLHYAILVADRSEADRRPVADLLARASSLLVIGQIPARCRSVTSFGIGPVCDQDSVINGIWP